MADGDLRHCRGCGEIFIEDAVLTIPPLRCPKCGSPVDAPAPQPGDDEPWWR
jgi:predicted Zn-ribbon and HTH transcriptional regulator